MLQNHFLGSEVLNEEDIAQRSSPGLLVQGTRDWVLAGWVMSYKKVKWAISNLCLKVPGGRWHFSSCLTRGPKRSSLVQ
jgi:hypothetical protein